MDLNLTDQALAFRDELRGWLAGWSRKTWGRPIRTVMRGPIRAV
jgi:hypothetical protein